MVIQGGTKGYVSSLFGERDYKKNQVVDLIGTIKRRLDSTIFN